VNLLNSSSLIHFLRGFGIQLAQSPFASAIGHNVLHFINDFIAEACGFGTP
jgi:hypothetical protein